LPFFDRSFGDGHHPFGFHHPQIRLDFHQLLRLFLPHGFGQGVAVGDRKEWCEA
jgi:hypothetical protein